MNEKMEWETELTFEDDGTFDDSFEADETFETEMDEVVEVVTSDHAKLTNRDAEDQHPIKAITNLNQTLERKLESAGFLSNLEIQAILES